MQERGWAATMQGLAENASVLRLSHSAQVIVQTTDANLGHKRGVQTTDANLGHKVEGKVADLTGSSSRGRADAVGAHLVIQRALAGVQQLGDLAPCLAAGMQSALQQFAFYAPHQLGEGYLLP